MAEEVLEIESPGLFEPRDGSMLRLRDLTDDEVEEFREVFQEDKNKGMRSCGVCNSAHLHLHTRDESDPTDYFYSFLCFSCRRIWHGPYQLQFVDLSDAFI